MKNFRTRLFIRILAIFSFLLLLFSTPMLSDASEQEAVFSGGCFWCLEHDLEDLPGVISAESGYSGGTMDNPTYENHSGHKESVIVHFDNQTITYKDLLRSFWRNIDPYDGEGQFCDRGDSYKPMIITKDLQQELDSIDSFDKATAELGASGEDIKVQIIPLNKFWIAEAYHQNFAVNNNLKYQFYRYSCGRDSRLRDVWGERAGSDSEWTEGAL